MLDLNYFESEKDRFFTKAAVLHPNQDAVQPQYPVLKMLPNARGLEGSRLAIILHILYLLPRGRSGLNYYPFAKPSMPNPALPKVHSKVRQFCTVYQI